METLHLTRACTSDKGTFGLLTYNDMPVCVTCEDPWKDNKRNISCIPAGTYRCQRYSSPKYPKSWQVMDVPGRSLILIHNGNTIEHTEGCILVGKAFYNMGGLPMVTESVPTMAMLNMALPDEFYLRIIICP